MHQATLPSISKRWNSIAFCPLHLRLKDGDLQHSVDRASFKNAISNAQEAKCSNTNDLMTSVLLDERNLNLINMIESEPSDIFVTYGSAHLYCGNAPLVSALKDRGYTLVSAHKYKYEM